MHGLLIHIAWYHRYPIKAQIHQLLHLLAGMACDHGLHRIFLQHATSSRPALAVLMMLCLVAVMVLYIRQLFKIGDAE